MIYYKQNNWNTNNKATHYGIITLFNIGDLKAASLTFNEHLLNLLKRAYLSYVSVVLLRTTLL